MSKYKIVAVLWDDHVYVDRDSLFKNPDDGIVLDLSVGILYQETDKVIVLINNIEKYDFYDDSSYTIILKSAIQSIKEYGKIELEELRSYK